MTKWQFYLDCGFQGTEPKSLIRLAEGEPEMCAELPGWRGVWVRTDSLYRQHMRGSDYDYEPTTPEARPVGRSADTAGRGGHPGGQPQTRSLVATMSSSLRS